MRNQKPSSFLETPWDPAGGEAALGRSGGEAQRLWCKWTEGRRGQATEHRGQTAGGGTVSGPDVGGETERCLLKNLGLRPSTRGR